MDTIRLFGSAQDARDYRHENGTGGWIFAPEDKKFPTILFPPDWYPHKIFHHPFTHGQTGNLIGSQ